MPALREKIVVRPMANRGRVAQPIGVWRRVFAGVAGAAVVVGMAIAIGSFTAAPQKPGMVATNPPKQNVSAPLPSQPKSKESVVAVNPPTIAHSPDTVASGAKAVSKTALKDGSYSVIEKDGRLALASKDGGPVRSALEARIAAAIEEKLRTGRIRPSKPVQMAMVPVDMRDGEKYVPLPTAPKLIGPSGKIVMSERPTFTWSKVEMAESYRIRVYDAQFQMVAEMTTKSTSLALSDALPRGRDYIWRVGVRFGEGDSWAESAPAKFVVLSSEDYSSIERIKRTMPGSHLALGAAYESFGLYDEARQEYRALRRANRDSSLARKLLYSVTETFPRN